MAKNPSNDAVQPTREASEAGPNKLADNAERGQLDLPLRISSRMD